MRCWHRWHCGSATTAWSGRCCWAAACWCRWWSLLNSALEAAIDRFGNEHHELAGRAKDMGSAAVFVAMLNAGAVWALVLVPRWLQTGG